MNYKEWLNEWLELYVKPFAKPQTYIKYEGVARLHLAPSLGCYNLEQLEIEILQRLVVNMSKKYASNTVNGVITVLQKSLKTALITGKTKVNNADKIVRPKPRSKKVECFTVAEQKKIEKYISESKKPKLFGITLCLYTGLRIGELLALQWKDIDVKNGVLYVNKSCHWGKVNGTYGIITDTPKTAGSAREIPVPRQLLPYIKMAMRKSDCNYVVSSSGMPVQIRSYQRSFEIILKKLDIPHKGFHSLRHTFATRAIECGMDIKTLSEILGHKNAEITLNRYAHSLMEHKCEMMNKLGRLLL